MLNLMPGILIFKVYLLPRMVSYVISANYMSTSIHLVCWYSKASIEDWPSQIRFQISTQETFSWKFQTLNWKPIFQFNTNTFTQWSLDQKTCHHEHGQPIINAWGVDGSWVCWCVYVHIGGVYVYVFCASVYTKKSKLGEQSQIAER